MAVEGERELADSEDVSDAEPERHGIYIELSRTRYWYLRNVRIILTLNSEIPGVYMYLGGAETLS